MGRQAMFLVLAAVLIFCGQACQTQHKIETVNKIEVAPMHITIDVNIKVDRALDDFFGDLDKTEQQIEKK
jgi:hypothetical protein